LVTPTSVGVDTVVLVAELKPQHLIVPFERSAHVFEGVVEMAVTVTPPDVRFGTTCGDSEQGLLELPHVCVVA
jgi:hypothetical protein